MREILFRGKRIDNKEWVQGGTYLNDPDLERTYIGGYDYYTTEDGFEREEYCCEVGPETVCQYIGLTDRTGRKIFEGDICKTHYANAKINGFVETIVFNSGRFCAFQGRDGCKSWAALYDGVPHLSIDKSVYMDEIEVIGNIFDNPELLEGNHAAGD